MARLVVVQKDGPNIEYETELLDCTRVCPADLFDAVRAVVLGELQLGFPQQKAPAQEIDADRHSDSD